MTLETTERLAPRVPRDRIVVGESGIFTPADIARLANARRRYASSSARASCARPTSPPRRAPCSRPARSRHAHRRGLVASSRTSTPRARRAWSTSPTRPATARTATAEGFVSHGAGDARPIAAGAAPKGDVLATARIAGIMAAKRTHELIPLCHRSISPRSSSTSSRARRPSACASAAVQVTGQTGVEMEALTAVSVACLTLYDMLKAVDRAMSIEGVRLIHKAGGRSGNIRPRKASEMALLPVDEALRRILDGASALGAERVDLLARRRPRAWPRTSPQS